MRTIMKTENPDAHETFLRLMQTARDSCNTAQNALSNCELIAAAASDVESQAWSLLKSNLKACLLLLTVIGISDRYEECQPFHDSALRRVTKGILQ